MLDTFSDSELLTIFTLSEDTSDELSQNEIELWKRLASKSIKIAKSYDENVT